ncbi:MAG: GIY-YIG nuclease family protein [Deltaproteobacteria bacterium]
MRTLEAEQKRLAWRVYILRCSDGSFYTGATNNLEKRLSDHNRGTASKYTRSRRPVTLLATSAVMNQSEALRLEINIKKIPKARKVACLKAAASETKVHHVCPFIAQRHPKDIDTIVKSD